MSFFHEAHGFVVNGGEFIGNQMNFVNGPSGIDVLLEASTPEAAVDAGERSYAPSCYPDTRVQYIEDITAWATASNGDHLPIYWMRGPAGVGKSAIAQTCAQMVKDSGHLGAAFFFSVNGRPNDHTRFFPTLAYQLATAIPDYRETVNRQVLKDKTLVTKTMRVQFESLIIEPLRELKEQGKEVRMRPIFIDGLDECESQNAQVEIIQLIAASVQAQSTPFRWAIFSRPEQRIASIFELSHISCHCRPVYLPISRDSDREVETYLRGGFENILRRRGMKLPSSWPTDEDIRKLVDAAAGLFAYCAAVLRFIDAHSFSGFKEALQAVLEVIMQPRARPIPLFADLDRLYTLILQRIPGDILPSMLLFLFWHTARDFIGKSRNVATYCNVLGISETLLKSIFYHLQAVMTYQEPVQPFQVLDSNVDLTHSYWDQDPSFNPDPSLRDQMHAIHGTFSILHKSFHDFLLDPNRSSIFRVSTAAMLNKFYDRLAQQHAHYASSYIIQGSKLVLAPGLTGSSTSLSWPQGTEFVDSYLKLYALNFLSASLSFGLPLFASSLGHLSSRVWQGLAELDHRMSCVARGMFLGPGLNSNVGVLIYSGYVRQVDGTIFGCIGSEGYDKFLVAKFLAGIKLLEDIGIIKILQPHVSSGLTPTCNAHSLTEPGKQHGLYILGRGEKSVVWYWEFDNKERYYYEFRTTNYTEAMLIYETEKFKMWNPSWVPLSRPSLDPAAPTSNLPLLPPASRVEPSEQSKSNLKGERQRAGALGVSVPQPDSTKATSQEPKHGGKRKADLPPPTTRTRRQRRGPL